MSQTIMHTWLALPSKRPPAEAELCLSKWRQQGYRIALWRDEGDAQIPCDLLIIGRYPGYHVAVNTLCREILARDDKAEWIVTGGDDMDPDLIKRAEEIARECTEHFGGTFGVMQPTGDRWGPANHIYSEHVCGSPFMGREYCRRMYGGRGPLCEEYWHFYGDEEMQELAVKYGILWQRRDLSHYHRHYLRERKRRPAFHAKVGSLFQTSGAIFKARKTAGFPGHEPIE